jgi:hypothetical protein
VKPTRAQVLGTLLLGIVFFAYLVIRYGHLFE